MSISSLLSLFKKRILKIVAILVITLLIIGFIILNYMAQKIASPYQSEIPTGSTKVLKAPEKYSLLIQSLSCLDGKVPTLVVEPDTSQSISPKAALLRKQLGKRNVSLKDHGIITGTVVILHGRTGRKEHAIGIAERFCAAGLRCILVDLPAHGESPVKTVKFGSTDWERDLPYLVLKDCASQLDFSTENVALWGMSMGGSFATAAVSDPIHGKIWDSVTIVCSFDSLAPVVKRKCKFDWLTNLTSALCVKHGGADFSQVTPAIWASQVTTPALIVHGENDELIPAARGKHLYESFASKDKRYLNVPDGNHDNILITPMPLYAEMADWILTHF